MSTSADGLPASACLLCDLLLLSRASSLFVMLRASGRAGNREVGAPRPTPDVRAAVPPRGRRTRADPISTRACFRPDDRTVSRLQAEDPSRRKRSARYRAGRVRLTLASKGADDWTRPPLTTLRGDRPHPVITRGRPAASSQSDCRQGAAAGAALHKALFASAAPRGCRSRPRGPGPRRG
jgi:hypothetical protein